MLFLESCSALESLHEMLVQEQAVSLCVGAVREELRYIKADAARTHDGH